jgi:hypothetical protein
MLTEKQAFIYGFLRRCRDEGLDAEATLARVAMAEKSAGAWDYAKSIPELVGLRIPALALAAGGAIGVGGGYLAAKSQENPMSPEDAQRNELLAAYNAFSDQVEERNRLRASGGVLKHPTGLR